MKKCVLILLCLLAIGCSPRVITQHEIQYVYKEKEKVDTAYVRDSIYLKEYIKGDTVKIYEYRDRIRYKDRCISTTDTLIVRDTVVVTKNIPSAPIKKSKSTWRWVLLLAGLALVGWRRELFSIIRKII